jgi:hypothetical protein
MPALRSGVIDVIMPTGKTDKAPEAVTKTVSFQPLLEFPQNETSVFVKSVFEAEIAHGQLEDLFLVYFRPSAKLWRVLKTISLRLST